MQWHLEVCFDYCNRLNDALISHRAERMVAEGVNTTSTNLMGCGNLPTQRPLQFKFRCRMMALFIRMLQLSARRQRFCSYVVFLFYSLSSRKCPVSLEILCRIGYQLEHLNH